MKLSTKGRYAMVALADLALAEGDDLMSLAAISKRQDVSLPYLEQLFVKLRRAGLVEAVRGPGGGYQFNAALLRHSDGVSLWDVIRIYQGQDDAETAALQSDSLSTVRAALLDSFRQSCERIPLLDLVSSIQPDRPETSNAAGPFKLKPLIRPMLPNGFNSVFQWAGAVA
jgi:Rrf2 family iron-sulfur cluster assembly transcriptional regulator